MLADRTGRYIVAMAPVGVGRSGGAIFDGKLAVPVGVSVHEALVTVAVKLTYSYDVGQQQGEQGEQLARLAAEQLPLSVDLPASERGAVADDLASPNDFCLFKANADVLLTGCCHADKARQQIHASLNVGSLSRSFCCVGPSPIERMPLTARYLREPDGTSPTVAVGPVAAQTLDPFEDFDEPVGHEPSEPQDAQQEPPAAPEQLPPPPEPTLADSVEDIDERLLRSWWGLERVMPEAVEEATSYATYAMRSRLGEYLPADALVRMSGLSQGGGPLAVRLPRLTPFLIAETRYEDYLVAFACDTLHIDTERRRITTVWRGQIPLITSRWEIRRLLLTLENPDDLRPLGVVYRDLPRGSFYRAVEPDDVRAGIEEDDPADDPELTLARYAEWDMQPEATIPIERYAQICAELSGEGSERRWVLANHGFDEDDWSLEDRAWLRKIGDSVMHGDGKLSHLFGEQLVQAKRALGGKQAVAISNTKEGGR